jgi:predicted transcriptional regulator with HTH domain
MAQNTRSEVLRPLNIKEDNILGRVRGEGPIEDIQETFRDNIHAANRLAKKELRRKVRDKLRKGVPGEVYDEEYAERKRNDPRAESNVYGSTGPVDFRYSGRLWDELVGRGRAKPSDYTLTVWLGLKHPNRKRPPSAPGGGGTTYRQLTRILKDEKPGPDGDPFSPTDEGRKEMAQKVADRLMGMN